MFGDRVGRREVCEVLWLQASCKQLGGGIETWKYEINMQHLNISLMRVLCCKASANWVQQVPFS